MHNESPSIGHNLQLTSELKIGRGGNPCAPGDRQLLHQEGAAARKFASSEYLDPWICSSLDLGIVAILFSFQLDIGFYLKKKKPDRGRHLIQRVDIGMRYCQERLNGIFDVRLFRTLPSPGIPRLRLYAVPRFCHRSPSAATIA